MWCCCFSALIYIVLFTPLFRSGLNTGPSNVMCTWKLCMTVYTDFPAGNCATKASVAGFMAAYLCQHVAVHCDLCLSDFCPASATSTVTSMLARSLCPVIPGYKFFSQHVYDLGNSPCSTEYRTVTLRKCTWVPIYLRLRTNLSSKLVQPWCSDVVLPRGSVHCTYGHRYFWMHKHCCMFLSNCSQARLHLSRDFCQQAGSAKGFGAELCMLYWSCLEQENGEHYSWNFKKAAVLGLDEYPEFPTTASGDAHVWVQVQYIKAGCALLPGWFEKLW